MNNLKAFKDSIAAEANMDTLETHWERLMVEMREPIDSLAMRDKQDALRAVLDRIASIHNASASPLPTVEHYKLSPALASDYEQMDAEAGRLRAHLLGKNRLNNAPDDAVVTKKLMALTEAMGRIEDGKAERLREITADAIQKQNDILVAEHAESLAQVAATEAAYLESLKPVEVQPAGDWHD